MKDVLGLIFIVAAIGISVGYTYPKWGDIGETRLEQQSLNEVKKEIEDVIDKKEQMEERYRQISSEDLEKVAKIMPADSDREGMLLMLNSLSRRTSMKLTSLLLTEAEQPGDFSQLKVNIGASGTYENMQVFLDELEHAVRLTDIETLTFSSYQKNTFNVSIAGTAYYLNELTGI